MIPNKVDTTSTDEQGNQDHKSLATAKAKTPGKSLSTSVEDSYMLVVYLALPTTPFVTIVQREDILLKYVNP